MAFTLNSTISGLITYSVTVPAAGSYPINGKLELPNIDQGQAANSAVVVTIVQNPSGSNTTIYTGAAGSRGFQLVANCSANDVLAITLSSAAAVDQPINAIKTSIAIG